MTWLMHRLCSPFLAVAVVTNGLKLGSRDGAAWGFFYIYVQFYISLCKHLSISRVLGWAQGFAAGVDTRVSPSMGYLSH